MHGIDVRFFRSSRAVKRGCGVSKWRGSDGSLRSTLYQRPLSRDSIHNDYSLAREAHGTIKLSLTVYAVRISNTMYSFAKYFKFKLKMQCLRQNYK